jgi:hypothetical protein
MMVILNNGTRIAISKETAQDIAKDLVKSNALQERWFCIVDSGSGAITAFNMKHVSAICDEDDVMPQTLH